MRKLKLIENIINLSDIYNNFHIKRVYKTIKPFEQAFFREIDLKTNPNSFRKGNLSEKDKKRGHKEFLATYSEDIFIDDQLYSRLENYASIVIVKLEETIEVEKTKKAETFEQIVNRLIKSESKDIQDLTDSLMNQNKAQCLLFLILYSVMGEYICQKKIIEKRFKIEKRPKLKSNYNYEDINKIFVGRDEYLIKIDQMLKNKEKYLFLYGIGGIGKSQLALQYGKKYKTVVFCEYTGSLVDTINDDNKVDLSYPFIKRIERTTISNQNYFDDKIIQLEKISNKKDVLFILDNVDEYNVDIKLFLKLPFDKIITTREKKYIEDHSERYIKVDKIEIDYIEEIFLHHSDVHDPNEAEKKCISDICELVDNNTMAIELIAKQIRHSRITIEKMYEILSDTNQLTQFNDTFDIKDTNGDLFFHLNRLFDTSGLCEKSLYILKCMTFMPLSGVDINTIKECTGLDKYILIEDLINRSWIQEKNNKISLHSLIRQVLVRRFSPNLINCSDFIKNLMDKNFHWDICEKYSSDEKKAVYDIAKNIYSLFDDIKHTSFIRYYNSDVSNIYDWIELTASHYSDYELSKEISNKLIEYYETEAQYNSFKQARSLVRIGCAIRYNNDADAALTNFYSGLKAIKEMPKNMLDSKMIDLYISDINLVIIYTLFFHYIDYSDIIFDNNPYIEVLNRIIECCNQVFNLRGKYNINEDTIYTSLIQAEGYKAMAECLINKETDNYEKAQKIVEAIYANIYNKEDSIKYTRGNIDEIISNMKTAISKRMSYFGKDNRFNSKYIELLGDFIMEKAINVGNNRKFYDDAILQYNRALSNIENTINPTMYERIEAKIKKAQSLSNQIRY